MNEKLVFDGIHKNKHSLTLNLFKSIGVLKNDVRLLDESKNSYDVHGFEHRRSRTSFTPDQLEILEQSFRANTYPDAQQRGVIAQKTGLSEGKIQVR